MEKSLRLDELLLLLDGPLALQASKLNGLLDTNDSFLETEEGLRLLRNFNESLELAIESGKQSVRIGRWVFGVIFVVFTSLPIIALVASIGSLLVRARTKEFLGL